MALSKDGHVSQTWLIFEELMVTDEGRSVDAVHMELLRCFTWSFVVL